MQLSKVIVMSVSAAAAAIAATTIGVSLFLNTSATDSSANSYETTPRENESLLVDAGIYNTSGTVLTASPNNDKSAVEQHSIATEPEPNKINCVLPESIVPSTTSDKDSDVVNTNTTVAENKSVHTENGNTEDNANPPAAEDNNPAKTTANADKTDASALANNVASNSNTLGNTPVSSPASAIPNTDSANKPAPVTPDSTPTNVAPDTDNSDKSAPTTNTVSRPSYDHTTSIYTDDWNTLLRVEYYDDNNKLFEYSSVTDYDKDTNSYTETVYRWDDEKDEEVAMRTDTYVNGELISSESP